jgi:hypothetical protein
MKTWSEVRIAGYAGAYGPRWICAAAIRLNNNDKTVLHHARHHFIIGEESIRRKRMGLSGVSYADQGFLTNTSEYISREEACTLALQNGQIEEKQYQQNSLFSEELWSL